MKFRIRVAESRGDVLRCQYLIAELYNRNYQIMFSEEIHDLEARIEPYPHRYLMGTIDGELVAALGLYTSNTYVERYGGITEAEIAEHLARSGVLESYTGYVRRELTKLVVHPRWEGRGLARLIHTTGHAAAFAEEGEDRPVLIMACGKVSVLSHLFSPKGKVTARWLAPFPRYPVHAAYRSETDGMESRLIIPAVDVPPEVRELQLPLEIELPDVPRRGAA